MKPNSYGDKAVFLKTCAMLLAGCTVAGWGFSAAYWGAFAGLVACAALLMWGDPQ